jgi:hypothetical protein
VTARATLEAPTRGQFDSTSGPCASYNCGPTDAAFVDGFYHDRKLSIAYVRSLAYSNCGPTNAAGVETMLDRLGVPSDQHYGTTVDLIKQVVRYRTRPIVFACLMSYIPDTYSKDSFNGAHWLVGCANSVDANGQTGVMVMDSNAPSSTGGFHFIPDWAISRALMGDSVIPRYAKVVASLPDTSTSTETHPVWLNNVKQAGGTIHFTAGAVIYSDPGKMLSKTISSSTAKRAFRLDHTDGTVWSGYVLADPYHGVRLVKHGDPHINITA